MYKNRHIITSRQDLCDELIELKETRTVKLAECLPTIFKLSAKKIADVENPEVDCKISDVLLYMKMCDAMLEITLDDVDWVDDIDSLRATFKREYRASKLSINDIAKGAKVSSRIIDNFIYHKGNMTVNSFLKVADAMGISLKIS